MESKKRILIADADVVFRDALIEALSEEGDMEVVGTTDDGERAVELVRSCKPDILVMDLILSHMDGLDVLAALDAAGRPKVMVLSALARSELEHLSVYTEVMQDAVVELIDAGKVACASGTALTISPSARERFYAHIDDYKGKIILRPQELSNAPEVIRRLSIIAMNTAIEMDIYGNVNSTHIMGSSMMNGIGGSGDFSRNAAITIFSAPSTAKGGKISSVVPMVSHVDHTEHEVMVLVTEQGFADLRGLSPKERAVKIIQNCAHPDFKDALMDYFERACEGNPSHTPHILNEALSWHIRFQKTGSMSV